ncbi:MAG TPA: tetratricopeptide repeat protein [Halomonas sp.]|nr:tetratricopeptide repeat protein [Halomonas sp.]
MKRLLCVLLLSVWSASATASPALPSDLIADLTALQQQLQQGALAEVVEQATAQAERLAGGNQSDQWASALYQQLAAGALARQDQPATAADRLAIARRLNGVDDDQAARWLREEASLRRAAGQHDQAIELLTEWLANQQDSDTVWQLIRLLAQQERWEEAASWLEQALSEAPELSEAQQALTLAIYRNAGQGEQALGWLLNGLNAQSDAADWRQAAGLAQQAGQAGVAAGLWEMAWQLGKLTQSEDRWLLIQLHLAGGTPARAAEHLEHALEEGEVVREESTLRLLASAWQQAKHIENALNAWQTLSMHTQSAADWRTYGQLAYAWGKDEQAKQAFTQASALGDEEAEQWLASFN